MHEYDVLLTISRSPEQRIRYSQLVEQTVYTKSGISRVSKRLEQRGHLERVRCEEDRRGAYAQLTTKGKKALAETWTSYSAAILEFFEPALNQQDAKDLIRITEKLISQLKPDSLVKIGALPRS